MRRAGRHIVAFAQGLHTQEVIVQIPYDLRRIVHPANSENKELTGRQAEAMRPERALDHGHGSQGGDFFRRLDAGPCEVHVERPGLCHDTSRLEGCLHR